MNMTKRIVVPVLFVICIILLVYFLFTLSGENKNAGVYSVRTFKSDDGWGYQINRKGDVIISQPYMPCVRGNKPFPDEGSAREVGELVLLKIKSTGDPSITMEELDKTINISDY